MITKLKIQLVFIALIFTSLLQAQQLFLPLDHDENAFVEMYLSDVDVNSHTSIKPYFYQDVKKTNC